MLLIRRAEGVPRPGFWSPPTGWVEPGESPAEAAVREAKEELGLEVSAEREVWHCHSDDGRLRIDWWQVTRLAGELRPDPAEVAAYRWVDAGAFFDLTPTFRQHHDFFRDRLPSLVGAPPAD
ncbi:NUDIX domain-containing protein [Lysobacter sp. CAU 1642]|uniref:NUDIX domain-containing protein n=2 Tax=Pseudomarimonas salicorniae TaxID=2933270 RepID=A0ABT0GJ11_9GAMM|nr:NUDIX domain-containing protein [Lysobacter sp. CAU 1642]